MHYGPENVKDHLRDRFVLSKGHASESYYAALAEKGFFPKDWLDKYLEPDCPLTVHPTNHVSGIEVNTGALGHGLPMAVGMALASRKSAVLGPAAHKYRVFVLTGDGETEEGSNWEAAEAAAYYKLGNLVWIVDNNGFQLVDRVSATMEIEPLADKIKAFGFDLHQADGTDPEALAAVFDSLNYAGDKPHAVIAKTIKGRGVSFMENKAEWHHRIPTAEECEQAIQELKG
jgi:transketolase